MADYAQYSKPDPEWEHASKLSQATPSGVPVEEGWAKGNQAIYEPQIPNGASYRVDDHTVPVRDGEIRIRVVIPGSQGGSFPVVVYFHGGGFMFGDIPMKDYRLRALSVKLNVATVNVEYRLQPFPRPQDDSYAALKWVIENAANLHVEPRKGFVVFGTSAGGQIAAVMAQRARDDPFFHTAPLTGQILQVPSTCHCDHYPETYKDRLLSMEQNKDAPTLTKENMIQVYEFLGGDPKDPAVSPLLAPSLEGLPRAVLQIAGLDPLRDEGILYGELLREAGVETKIEIYPGMPHSFEDTAFESQAGKKWAQHVEDAVKWMIYSP